MLQYVKFGQHPSFGSIDRVETSCFGQNLIIQSAGVTSKMRSVLPKTSHFFPPPSQLCVCGSLVKIHPEIVHETECREEATRTPTPTGSAPKAICPPPLWLWGGGGLGEGT